MADDDNNGGWRKGRAAKGLRAFGQRAQEQGQEMIRASQDEAARLASARSADIGLEARQQAQVSSMRRGGKVRRTGIARLHRGEHVIPRRRAKKLRKQGRL